MLYRIQRFGIKQTSRVAGIVYFVLGIVLLPFFYLLINTPPGPGQPPRENASLGSVLLVPFINGLVGYLMTALILYIYNQTAKRVGGVELDIVYATEPPPDHPAAGNNPGTSAMR